MDFAPETLQLLTTQWAHEHTAASLYTALHSRADALGFLSAASFFRAAADEERGHASQILDYVNERDELRPGPIAAPACDCQTLLELYQLALAAEQANTAQWQAIASQALIAADFDALRFAQAFLDGQRQSENELFKIVTRLARMGETQADLYDLEGHEE